MSHFFHLNPNLLPDGFSTARPLSHSAHAEQEMPAVSSPDLWRDRRMLRLTAFVLMVLLLLTTPLRPTVADEPPKEAEKPKVATLARHQR